MTVIAWDGTTLAADKASTNAGYRSTVTKIHRVDGALVALAGTESAVMAGLAWLKGARNPHDYPEAMKNTDSLMWEIRKGEFLRYGEGPYPARVEDKFLATGSGRDYALAAMYLGFGAVMAVQVACALDIGCGNGIDTLTLED
jgi:ATP-dependent protease HslVU (ClpYQ) peptidase subunit